MILNTANPDARMSFVGPDWCYNRIYHLCEHGLFEGCDSYDWERPPADDDGGPDEPGGPDEGPDAPPPVLDVEEARVLVDFVLSAVQKNMYVAVPNPSQHDAPWYVFQVLSKTTGDSLVKTAGMKKSSKRDFLIQPLEMVIEPDLAWRRLGPPPSKLAAVPVEDSRYAHIHDLFGYEVNNRRHWWVWSAELMDTAVAGTVFLSSPQRLTFRTVVGCKSKHCCADCNRGDPAFASAIKTW